MKDTLKYYNKINAIPTVDYKDYFKGKAKSIKNHRYFFYFKVGVNIDEFYKKNILEFCPGTGYNAQYILEKNNVKSYTLVDYNPQSIIHLKKNLKKFKHVKIIRQDIRKFNSNKMYDFLIFENAIDAFKDAKKIFIKSLKLLNKNGTLVISIGDYFGQFSTKLRYLLSIILCDKNKIKSHKGKVNFLSKYFERDLKYLSKNSRDPKKWVIDNILNTEMVKKDKKTYFDYNSLSKLNLKNYVIKQTSPSFTQDYVWYKNFSIKKHHKDIFKSYNENRINLIDFETRFKNEHRDVCIKILDVCRNINKMNFGKKIKKKDIDLICKGLIYISKKIHSEKNNNKISNALKEFVELLKNHEKSKYLNRKPKNFYKFWGIAMQHLSIQRFEAH